MSTLRPDLGPPVTHRLATRPPLAGPYAFSRIPPPVWNKPRVFLMHDILNTWFFTNFSSGYLFLYLVYFYFMHVFFRMYIEFYGIVRKLSVQTLCPFAKIDMGYCYGKIDHFEIKIRARECFSLLEVLVEMCSLKTSIRSEYFSNILYGVNQNEQEELQL